MFPVSPEYKAIINSDSSRNWKIKLGIQTAFEMLELDENDIKMDSLTLKESVVNGSKFSIGGCVPADLSVTLINENGKYDGIQFNGSTVKLYIGLEIDPGTFEWVPLGVFTVDNVEGNIHTPDLPVNEIKLQAGDNLIKFDRPFSNVPVQFPCTALSLLSSVCGYCGVPLATTSFLHANYVISTRPDGDMSCRDVVAHIAEMAASWARCNRLGQLELVWFKNPAPIQEAVIDGNVDTIDGGDFFNWNTGSCDGGVFKEDEPDIVLDGAGRYDFTINDAPITITGVSFEMDDKILLAGSARYAIHISDNPFIQDNAEDVVRAIWERLKGFTFLPYSTYRRDDPAIQAGDMVRHIDVRGREYKSIITGYEYVFGGKSLITAAGTSEAASGYRSSLSKTVSQLRRKIAEKQEQIDALDLAVKNAFAMLAGVWGGYVIIGDELGGEHQGRIYLSDHKDITQAQKIWVYSLGGIGYFPNGLSGEPISAWTADGHIVASLITASMIRTGILQSLNGKSWINLDDGSFSLGDGALVFDGTTYKVLGAEKLTNAASDGTYGTIGKGPDENNQYGFFLNHPTKGPIFTIYPFVLSDWAFMAAIANFYGDAVNFQRKRGSSTYEFLNTHDNATELVWTNAGGSSSASVSVGPTGITLEKDGAPYGVTGSPGTGQKPVFVSGICVGYSY